ncbi:MAG: DUF5752 family protein [Nanoarchaeota archaeon]|nr:DUF5752 family protein [Nanoarchaeota archaeon]
MIMKIEEIKRILSDIKKPGQVFFFYTGQEARNLYELIEGIEELTDDEFVNYVNYSKNDFSDWVRDALRYPELADHLQHLKHREEFLKVLKREVMMLEEALFPEMFILEKKK